MNHLLDQDDFYLVSDLTKARTAVSLIRDMQSLKDDVIDGEQLRESLAIIDEWITKHEIGLDVRLNG